jgi:sirohydrochlorin ferrochelatase
MVTFLVDNGSLAPAATLRLREIAAALAERIQSPVAPVSLLHASAVPAEQLAGVPAEILEPALARRMAGGEGDVVVVPLFFGPSRALTDYLPARVEALKRRSADLRVRLAPVLHQAGDNRLARILAAHIAATGETARVALVDHGSPVPEVTVVREELAEQLRRLLGPAVDVAGCCMERREGAPYDFNGPLLAELLDRPGWNHGPVTIAMQFLLPGRHAGPDGDVAQICRGARTRHPELRPRLTALVGEHPLMIDILADRWRTARSSSPL